MPNIAYLNGQFLPIDEAKVSIEDRGFQFGDGVYEVIRVYQGKPFRSLDHLARLKRSAEAINIPMPLNAREWEYIVTEGIGRSGYSDGKVYIQLTRGAAPRDHLFPGSPNPTIVMTIHEIQALEPSVLQRGVAAIMLPDLRWGRCSIKSLNLLPNLLAKQQAKEAGALEAILVRDGFVTEGTASNVMLVARGTLVTPALGDNLLAGVTRLVVLELARKQGIVVEERNVSEEELRKADELFLIGTTIEVIPVTKLDGKAVSDGTVGEVTKRLATIFQATVLEECTA